MELRWCRIVQEGRDGGNFVSLHAIPRFCSRNRGLLDGLSRVTGNARRGQSRLILGGN